MSDCIADMLREVGGWGEQLPSFDNWSDTINQELAYQNKLNNEGIFGYLLKQELGDIENTSSDASPDDAVKVSELSAQPAAPLPKAEEMIQKENASQLDENAPKLGEIEESALSEEVSELNNAKSEAQQKGFFNKWVIGGLAVGAVAVAAVITALFKNKGK